VEVEREFLEKCWTKNATGCITYRAYELRIGDMLEEMKFLYIITVTFIASLALMVICEV